MGVWEQWPEIAGLRRRTNFGIRISLGPPKDADSSATCLPSGPCTYINHALLKFFMQPFIAPGLLLSFQPLLLERSYGGAGEGIFILLQGIFSLLVMAVVLAMLVKLSNRAEEIYEDGYRRLVKKVGIGAAVFAAIYALASFGGP
jgi:hypothetical protein